MHLQGLYHILQGVASLCKRGDTMNNDLKIGFIGAGKVGFSLGKFFVENHIQVTGYYSRHQESAAKAADFTGTGCYETLQKLIHDSDAIFLTVPDGVIMQIYQELQKYDLTDKMICHCSGALSSREAFPGINACGASGYSIHPLFPISSRYESYRELTDAFFCLEGEEEGLSVWQTIFTSCGVRTRCISPEKKVAYHCGCAIASNLVCALLDESFHLFAECGFSEEEAMQALAPLVESNMRHILQKGSRAALTGPLERGDAQTVAKHLQVLSRNDAKEMYRASSLRLLEVAKQKNPERNYTGIEELLSK